MALVSKMQQPCLYSWHCYLVHVKTRKTSLRFRLGLVKAAKEEIVQRHFPTSHLGSPDPLHRGNIAQKCGFFLRFLASPNIHTEGISFPRVKESSFVSRKLKTVCVNETLKKIHTSFGVLYSSMHRLNFSIDITFLSWVLEKTIKMFFSFTRV